MRETTVETGAVRGIPCGWPSITAFYGIPYASPPVGELRWRPPRPAQPWEGVRDCARPGAKCPQSTPGGYARKEFYPCEERMSEDCLYLNIWTPAQSQEEKLPVLFWIHGGAYVTGYGHSSHFDGEHFARQGVILVTINYRLNIFGWLVHPELSAENGGRSGNYGLMDQLCALEWVRRNIHAFGGDPERITLAGQSAGAMSVNCLLHSPLLPSGIRGAILQSGGGLMGFSDMSHYRTVAQAEARADLPGELGVSSIAQARALSDLELNERWQKIGFGRSKLQTCPVLDGVILTKPMEDTALAGEQADIPTLLGYTGAENVPTMPTPDLFRAVMRQDMGEKKAEEFFALCPLEDPEAWKTFMFSSCTELLRSSCEAWGELVERQGKQPAYVYALTRNLPGDDLGPYHAACLPYVFKTFMRLWRPWTGQDYEIAAAMNTFWANFAKYGTPNGANGLNEKVLPTWVPYTAGTRLTMEFGDTVIGMRRQPENPRVTFRREAMLALHKNR